MNYTPSISMHKTFVCLAAGLALLGPLEAQQGQAAPPAYDQAGYYPTSLLAPDVPLSGDQFKVRSKGYDDGLVATYWVDANDGTTYRAVGKGQLYQRIAEIYAIAKLREMDSGQQFGDAAGNTAKNTVTAVGDTLSDPGKFIKGIPQGASKFFGSIGEGLKGGHSEYEGKAYSNVLGQSKAKRMLAVQLGVSPYSTNETLQKELNRVGWSKAGGALTINLAVSAIPAGAGLGLNMNRNLQTQIAEKDPNQLNIMNRKKLLSLGVSHETADLLLQHEWYSPVHRTVITEALASLGPDHGQDIFLKTAARAGSEVDANYFQEMAQLIEKYNQSENPVQTLLRSGNTVSFIDSKGTWVFPVPFDYALWTATVHERATRAFAARKPGEPLLFYTTGRLSEAAKAACERDGAHIQEGVSLQ